MKRTLSVILFAAMLAALCACGLQPAEPVPQQPPVQTEPQQPASGPAAPTEPEAGDIEAPALSGTQDSFNRTWPEMQDAGFWIGLAEDPQSVRMTAEEIADYNAALAGVEGADVEDLSAWPQQLSAGRLLALLRAYGEAPDSGLFTPEGPITADQQATIRSNRNEAALAADNPVQYGFLTENVILRSYPSSLPLYGSPDSPEYDLAAETALKLWEPLLVLHPSADSGWYLVRSYDYLGWVPSASVALCGRSTWDSLCRSLQSEGLTVLAPKLPLEGSFSNPGQQALVLKMGTVLPLVSGSGGADNASADNCYIVRLPQRKEDGTLGLVPARIPKNEDVAPGFLPFTTENLLRQAFKLLGRRYGWGGTAEGWDCSSLCQDVYRTMGIFLPRNSGSQRRVPGCFDVEGSTVSEKQALLEELLPGAMLELRGHQTLYIGSFDGEDYVIHATHGVYDALGRFYNANAVIVSSAEAFRSNGRTLMENFRAFSMPEASAN